MIEPCEHNEAHLDLSRDGSDAWLRVCPCGLIGGGGTVREAWRVFEINAKRERGEKLTDEEWTVLAYTPASQGGTAAGCSSTTYVRSFLLGST